MKIRALFLAAILVLASGAGVSAPARADAAACDEMLYFMLAVCDGDSACNSWALHEYADCLEDAEEAQGLPGRPGG